ncbi:MAG: metal-dependent hydrolase [Candidatus Schekmanbacteria bacterium]|nr:metal-dependent hydrolase [Candidatus Schekmanbacteria bacterium]
MPTSVGHALGGALAYLLLRNQLPRRNRGLFTTLMAAGALGTAADLDFAVGPLLGQAPGAFHHGFTHSLGFAALVAVAVAALRRAGTGSAVSPQTKARAEAAAWSPGLIFAVYSSHIGLDLVAQDFVPPIGMQLFWPLTDQYFGVPLHLFLSVERDGPEILFGWGNVIAVAGEILLLLPPFVGLLWWRLRPGQPWDASVTALRSTVTASSR